jgi:maltooligosyltrehalose synthase
VPDIYQGTELWDFSLVDPDNRRPVDYAVRSRLLRTLGRRKPTPRLADNLTTAAEDGRIKLYLTARTLSFRVEQPDLFARGSYLPLETAGNHSANVFAFARELGNQRVVLMVPRLVDSLLRGEAEAPVGSAVWGDTAVRLPESEIEDRYRNLFTGTDMSARESIEVATSLAHFPVALLVRIDTA